MWSGLPHCLTPALSPVSFNLVGTMASVLQTHLPSWLWWALAGCGVHCSTGSGILAGHEPHSTTNECVFLSLIAVERDLHSPRIHSCILVDGIPNSKVSRMLSAFNVNCLLEFWISHDHFFYIGSFRTLKYLAARKTEIQVHPPSLPLPVLELLWQNCLTY